VAAGDRHAAKNLPTEDEARDFLRLFGLEPSIVIRTGGGMHCYWLFSRPWVFKDHAARKQATDQVGRFQKAMIALAAARGWWLDNTSDLARVLRLPNTTNHETTPPAPVAVTDWHPERRYSYPEVTAAIEALEEAARAAGQSPRGGQQANGQAGESDQDTGPPPRADLIAERCAWIEHCRFGAATLPEAEWYGMVGVIARCEDGPATVHEWSRPYPGYSERETSDKIRHALEDAGPITCWRVEQDFGPGWCVECAYHGKVKSPITLGRERQSPAWEPPIPFTEYDLPPFPTDALPKWLREYVEAEAEATQAPPDLAGVLALAVCGAAIAKKIVVFVRPGWTEPTNLFTVTALPPGSRKTAVFADVTDPVNEYERELTEAMAPEIEARRSERKIMEAALAAKQAEAAKAKVTDRDRLTQESSEIARRLATFKVPAIPRLIADDCSPERLAGMLAEQGGKMAVMAPEGDVFDLMAGRYGNGANFGVYLRGHAGDDLRVDRVGRPPEYVHSPALTVSLAVQPDVLRGLIQKPGFRGRGLLGRFLYSIPRSNIGTRKIRPAPMPESVRGAYRRNVRALLSLAAGTSDTGEPAAHALRLAPEAQAEFEVVEAWLEPRLAETADLGTIQDWAAKLAGAVARIAGILHVAEHADKPAPWAVQISGQTMQAAINLGKYLIPHAQAAFQEMGADPDLDAARYVLGWLLSRGIEKISKRDLFNGVRGRFKRVKALDPALAILEEHGYIRQVKNDRDGAGRPSTLQVEGDKIKYRYTGPGQPDRDRAKRLLAEVAAHKAEALNVLAAQRGAMVFPGHDTTPGPAPAASAETPPGGLGLDEARRRHDDILLRLAEEVPRGFVGWARVHRPKEWQELEDDYAQARLLIVTGEYATGLAAVEAWAAANRQLYDEYLRTRTLAEMDPGEAGKVIIDTFDATPICQAREGGKQQNCGPLFLR